MKKLQDFLVEHFPQDKLLHFVAGFIIYNLAILFLNDILSFFVVMFIALAKEVRDQIVYKGGDVTDYIFTVAPAFVMLIINNLK